MKILFVAHEEQNGGASLQLLDLIEELKENHEIYVLVSKKEGEFYKLLLNQNVNIIVEPYFWWCLPYVGLKQWIKETLKWYLFRKWINISTSKKLSKFIIDNNIDIVHTNTCVTNIGLLIHKYSGVKHIWHIHEIYKTHFNFKFFEPEFLVKKEMNNNTDMFIFVSKAVSNEWKFIDQSKKRIVYNGIKRTNINKKNDGNFNILVSGSIEKYKGQEEAYLACKKVIESGANDVRLFFAGYGIPYFEVCNEMKDYVSFLGFIKDMSALRNKIDIELVCSKSEAFGRVTAEAMMHGIPVIGTNSGGTRELIQDGITGFLYQRGNIEELAEKILLLKNNNKLRDEIGSRAKKFAQINFSVESFAGNIEKIYFEL